MTLTQLNQLSHQSPIFGRAANWFERESHDLFGVVFDDHPSLDRLLLPDDFEGNPGLKSYPLHEYKEW